ncbi:3-oxoacyl-[acyl-carrier-protein] synthase III C-terminal domain-containing protein [Porticoccaceae bacterium LTM1]|nr:3-oxoacyl-[acyl-carrier-protein] synthase III C-terminal domain-containing protein [Porticoccaceae bacterium LTM1]
MARIEATGSYLPEKVVSNDAFDKDSAIFESIAEFLDGYEQRRHAAPGESGLSMAVAAAKNAFESSQYTPDDIDGIIGVVVPNEYLYGEDLNLLQHEIGAVNASVLPINTTCSTFLSALNLADSLIASGKKSRILIVVAVNWVNNILDVSKPNYGFAGDGAAAVIVDDKSQSLIDVCEVNNSIPPVFTSMVMKNPVLSGQKEYFQISEPEGVSTAKDLILGPIKVGKKLLARNPDIRIDKVFMHQSGEKMMSMWMDKLGLPMSIVRHTLPLYANMTMANIPVSLDYWVKRRELKRGETVLFFSPAAGGHYISMLWKY